MNGNFVSIWGDKPSTEVPTLLGALIEWKRVGPAFYGQIKAVPTLLGALIEWKHTHWAKDNVNVAVPTLLGALIEWKQIDDFIIGLQNCRSYSVRSIN